MGLTWKCCVPKKKSKDSVIADGLVNNEQNFFEAPNSDQETDESPRYYYTTEEKTKIIFRTESDLLRFMHKMSISTNLPVWTLSRGELNVDIDECVICIEPMENGNKIKSLPCAHTFHKSCIDMWLKVNLTCPICSENVEDALVHQIDSN